MGVSLFITSTESNVISFSMKVILNCHWVIKTLGCIDGTDPDKVLIYYNKLWLQESCQLSNNLGAHLIH